MCSLRFENNMLSSEGVRFASISKKTQLLKLSFAFVSLALPLLACTYNVTLFAPLPMSRVLSMFVSPSILHLLSLVDPSMEESL